MGAVSAPPVPPSMRLPQLDYNVRGCRALLGRAVFPWDRPSSWPSLSQACAGSRAVLGGAQGHRGVDWGACLCTSWACPQQYVLLQAFSAPPRPLHPRLHCLYLSRRLAECREDEPVSGQLPDCWLHLPAACCPDDVRVSWVSHQGCPKAGCCLGWVGVAGRWEGQFKAPAKEGCEHPSHRSAEAP